MSSILTYLVFNGLIVLLLEIVILWRGIHKGLYSKYLPFYFYLTAVIGIAVLRWCVFLSRGYGSREYYFTYQITNLLFPPLQLWILWDVYQKLGSANITRFGYGKLGILCGIAVLPIGVGIVPATITFFDKFHTLTLPLQAVFCLAVCVSISRNRQIILGLNERGIILGLSTLLGLQSVNFAYRVFELGDYVISMFFVQFIFIIMLIILASCLWDYHPSQVLDADLVDRRNRIGGVFAQVMKLFLFRR